MVLSAEVLYGCPFSCSRLFGLGSLGFVAVIFDMCVCGGVSIVVFMGLVGLFLCRHFEGSVFLNLDSFRVCFLSELSFVILTILQYITLLL